MMTIKNLQTSDWFRSSSGRRAIYLLFVALFTPAQSEAQENLSFRQVKQLEFALQENAKLGQKAFVAIAVAQNGLQQEDPARVFDNLLNPESDILPASVGAGMIVEIKGSFVKVLTTAHLFDSYFSESKGSRPSSIFVRFASQETATASVLASDPRSDLAILQVESKRLVEHPDELASVRVSKAFNPRKGMFVTAIGSPWSLAKDGATSIHLGLISNLNRKQSLDNSTPDTEQTIHDLGTLLEVGLLDPRTSSGTLLLNVDGEFSGMITSLGMPANQQVTSTYAIPMTSGMLRIVNELKQGYEVDYGFLGISPETSRPEDIAGLNLNHEAKTAVIVSRLAKNSPAQKSGIHREDFILRINDATIATNSDLLREVGFVSPGETAEILIYRINEGQKQISVQVGKWPIYDDSKLVATQRKYSSWRGIHVDFPTARRRYLPDRFLSEFPEGVVISHIEPESPAASTGLQVGQFITRINDQIVQSPEEFHTAAKSVTGEATLHLGAGTDVVVQEDSTAN